ncbi:hypothetical protein BT63DRAFT_478868 [Microthyrium microscopicum]|uniref:RRM domain-containing protein n=1 Tax=Microthyrium microscopicum TaxID=703497 RepID=A0A6A6UDI9_9PEZI|nr:hypothetical protein BT63DRAFT_478868 [Microthyrium microscopicum]
MASPGQAQAPIAMPGAPMVAHSNFEYDAKVMAHGYRIMHKQRVIGVKCGQDPTAILGPEMVAMHGLEFCARIVNEIGYMNFQDISNFVTEFTNKYRDEPNVLSQKICHKGDLRSMFTEDDILKHGEAFLIEVREHARLALVAYHNSKLKDKSGAQGAGQAQPVNPGFNTGEPSLQHHYPAQMPANVPNGAPNTSMMMHPMTLPPHNIPQIILPGNPSMDTRRVRSDGNYRQNMPDSEQTRVVSGENIPPRGGFVPSPIPFDAHRAHGNPRTAEVFQPTMPNQNNNGQHWNNNGPPPGPPSQQNRSGFGHPTRPPFNVKAPSFHNQAPYASPGPMSAPLHPQLPPHQQHMPALQQQQGPVNYQNGPPYHAVPQYYTDYAYGALAPYTPGGSRWTGPEDQQDHRSRFPTVPAMQQPPRNKTKNKKKGGNRSRQNSVLSQSDHGRPGAYGKGQFDSSKNMPRPYNTIPTRPNQSVPAQHQGNNPGPQNQNAGSSEPFPRFENRRNSMNSEPYPFVEGLTENTIPPEVTDITSLWIGHIGLTVSDYDLREHFDRVYPGSVDLNCQVTQRRDHPSAAVNGFAWSILNFTSADAARKGLLMDGSILNNHPITVRVPRRYLPGYEQKPHRSSFNNGNGSDHRGSFSRNGLSNRGPSGTITGPRRTADTIPEHPGPLPSTISTVAQQSPPVKGSGKKSASPKAITSPEVSESAEVKVEMGSTENKVEKVVETPTSDNASAKLKDVAPIVEEQTKPKTQAEKKKKAPKHKKTESQKSSTAKAAAAVEKDIPKNAPAKPTWAEKLQAGKVIAKSAPKEQDTQPQNRVVTKGRAADEMKGKASEDDPLEGPNTALVSSLKELKIKSPSNDENKAFALPSPIVEIGNPDGLSKSPVDGKAKVRSPVATPLVTPTRSKTGSPTNPSSPTSFDTKSPEHKNGISAPTNTPAAKKSAVRHDSTMAFANENTDLSTGYDWATESVKPDIDLPVPPTPVSNKDVEPDNAKNDSTGEVAEPKDLEQKSISETTKKSAPSTVEEQWVGNPYKRKEQLEKQAREQAKKAKKKNIKTKKRTAAKGSISISGELASGPTGTHSTSSRVSENGSV